RAGGAFHAPDSRLGEDQRRLPQEARSLMKTIKGPAIFLAQFAGTAPHLQNFNDMCKWAKECGFIGVQLPSWDGRVMDLAQAAESQAYCAALTRLAARQRVTT